jgi:hypothetical protein
MKKIIKQVIEALNTVAGKLGTKSGNRQWTPAVKAAIGDVGIKNGYKACASVSSREDFRREWLFDLTWYDGEDGLCSIPLVMESELKHSKKELILDFEKLHVAKAKIKLFVFESDQKGIEKKMQFLEDSIRKYKDTIKGELYLLACLNFEKSPHEFKIKKIQA